MKKSWAAFTCRSQFEAQARGTLALLGASGCGKSMTLKCIAGIVTPDRGRIVLNDRVLFDSAAHIDLPPQRRQDGLSVPAVMLCFPTMTVEQNILCGIRRQPRRKSGSRPIEMLSAGSGWRGWRISTPPSSPADSSSGWLWPASSAPKPEAILLDEPFSALDSYLKWQLELELSDLLAAFRGPILWVSHDRGEVFRSCRQICVLDHGHSQGTLTPEQLLHRPGTESAARLSGCENIVEAHPAGDAVLLPQWGLTLPCGRAVPPDCGKIGIPGRIRSRRCRRRPPVRSPAAWSGQFGTPSPSRYSLSRRAPPTMPPACGWSCPRAVWRNCRSLRAFGPPCSPRIFCFCNKPQKLQTGYEPGGR